MAAFLTPDDVHRLTGARQKRRQVAWLRARRIKHYVNLAGEPVVAWAWLEASGELVAFPVRPNLAAVRSG